METLRCFNKMKSAGISSAASESLCSQYSYKINPNSSVKEILCAIKHGNKACSEMRDYQVE